MQRSRIALAGCCAWLIFACEHPAGAKDNSRDWKIGVLRKVAEDKRFVPAAEQPPRGVSGQWGMDHGVTMGVTRRLAVYTIEAGSRIYVLEEGLKGRARPCAFAPGDSVRFAIGDTDRAWFIDPAGKKHKAQLAEETFRAPGGDQPYGDELGRGARSDAHRPRVLS